MTNAAPRVLIVSHGHPAFDGGGAELCAHDLFLELRRAGLADAYFLGCVTALHRPSDGECSLQSYDSAEREFLLHVGEFDPVMLAHGMESRSLDDFGRVLDRLKPDIVHFHHLYQIGAESLALARNRVPRARFLLTLHDFHPICHHDGLMIRTDSGALCKAASADACHACFGDISSSRFALRTRHLQNMLALVDRFVVPSQFLGRRFADWGIDETLITHIPNGVPEDIAPLNAEDPGKRNRFAYFGNIAPHKGILVALEAAARIGGDVDLTLTLHGEMHHQGDAFMATFSRGLKRAGNRAFYRGPYERRDVSELMAAADWIIVPSTWWENAPLTILEAFRHQRPVIASDIGGMAEMVDHGVNGFLFRKGDADGLARLISDVATADGLWDRLAAATPPVPTTEETAGRHAALYAELLSIGRQKIA